MAVTDQSLTSTLSFRCVLPPAGLALAGTVALSTLILWYDHRPGHTSPLCFCSWTSVLAISFHLIRNRRSSCLHLTEKK